MSNFDLFLTIQPTEYGYRLQGDTEVAPNAMITVEAKFIGDLIG